MTDARQSQTDGAARHGDAATAMVVVVADRPGGPEVMSRRIVPMPSPAAGEALVRIAAVGINYIDIYFRTGLYPGSFPFVPGQEAAGTVAALGDGVTEVSPGDRVAYATSRGSYAEYAVVPAAKLLPVPDDVELTDAAAGLLQGMAAYYLTHETYAIMPRDIVLVHAAAGGLGLLLVQMARIRGARVIGTVSSPEKARRAREAGADEVILYTEVDFEPEVRRLTGGAGVRAVYDSVGRTTFDRSLRCLGRRGQMILCGLSSGPVDPIDPSVLQRLGSLSLTRTSLADYVYDRASLLRIGGEILHWIGSGDIRLTIAGTGGLDDVRELHRLLESRGTVGKLLLLPEGS